MNQEILQTLGLSPNEGKIYTTLVEKGESSISDISIAAGIHRRNAYDAVHRLIEKGLMFQIASKESNYNAVDPDKLSELFSEKAKQLAVLVPELKKKFARRLISQESYIYRGLEGQKNILRDVLRVGKDSYFIGAKGGWFDPRLESERTTFFKAANRKNIKFIQLWDYEIKQKGKELIKNFPGKLEYRFLPREFSTNSAIHIFGNYVITYTGLHVGKISDDIVFFVIHSQALADSYRKWFGYMWSRSTK